MAIGDDDVITNEINDLFKFIYQKKILNDWIFLPTFSKNKKIFINNFKNGYIKNYDVYKDCLSNTIYKYGYIGSHLIRHNFVKKTIKNKSFNIRWPHISFS